eukprot:Skav221806  [mRNA]  locus=scaffold2435:112525:113214:- [translate_table: standard]
MREQTTSDYSQASSSQRKSREEMSFLLYHAFCWTNRALQDVDFVHMELLGLTGEEAKHIRSTVDRHHGKLRRSLMGSLCLGCVLTLLGGLVTLGQGETCETCKFFECTGLILWCLWCFYAMAYFLCLADARNEKASSDLNLHFQDHPRRLYFRLTFEHDPLGGDVGGWIATHRLVISHKAVADENP